MPCLTDRLDLAEKRLKIAVEVLDDVAGNDCYQADKYLGVGPCGKCQSCLARAALKAIDEARIAP